MTAELTELWNNVDWVNLGIGTAVSVVVIPLAIKLFRVLLKSPPTLEEAELAKQEREVDERLAEIDREMEEMKDIRREPPETISGEVKHALSLDRLRDRLSPERDRALKTARYLPGYGHFLIPPKDRPKRKDDGVPYLDWPTGLPDDSKELEAMKKKVANLEMDLAVARSGSVRPTSGVPENKYRLRALPRPDQIGRLQGKNIYLRSAFPAVAQVVDEGRLTATLRINENARHRSTDLYTESMKLWPDYLEMYFYNTTVGNMSVFGVHQTKTNCTVEVQNQFPVPEVFDLHGFSILLPHDTTKEEANFLTRGSFHFQWSASQEKWNIPIAEIPIKMGGLALSQRQPEFYDIRVDKWPSRIWASESFTVYLRWDNPKPLPTGRALPITMQMHGNHYFK